MFISHSARYISIRRVSTQINDTTFHRSGNYGFGSNGICIVWREIRAPPSAPQGYLQLFLSSHQHLFHLLPFFFHAFYSIPTLNAAPGINTLLTGQVSKITTAWPDVDTLQSRIAKYNLEFFVFCFVLNNLFKATQNPVNLYVYIYIYQPFSYSYEFWI